MNPFPIHILRSLTQLFQEIESSERARNARIQRLLFLFNSLQAERVDTLRDWQEVMRHAEVLGELLHEIDQLSFSVLHRRKAPKRSIEAFQERLFQATNSEKLISVILSLSRESRIAA